MTHWHVVYTDPELNDGKQECFATVASSRMALRAFAAVIQHYLQAGSTLDQIIDALRDSILATDGSHRERVREVTDDQVPRLTASGIDNGQFGNVELAINQCEETECAP